MHGLTKDCPKALLKVSGFPLIYYSLYSFYKWGIRDAVINLHYLGEQIKESLKDFPFFPIYFSDESTILETAGGIRYAMDSFFEDDEDFILINPDTIFVSGKNDNPVGAQASGSNSLLYLQKRNEADVAGIDFRFDTTHLDFCENGSLYYIGLARMNTKALLGLERGASFPLGKVWRKQSKNNKLEGKIFNGKVLSVGTKEEYAGVKDDFPFEAAEKENFLNFIKDWKGEDYNKLI